MRLIPRLALAALSGALGVTALAATPAAARTSVTIDYRDGAYRDHRGYDRHRHADRRDWRWDRRDRYERRAPYRGWHQARRCWTEWRYDRRYHQRYRVRFCR